ncbi:MerR-like DNA binding protein [Nocardia tenerifensis]|uniref:MerR-like DNA binding protein n=1 Tax=Nocardia tenerifensis TaxID=228006 RepID=A0A318JUN9_9NOCA|nr:MerR family transcriptional regulator [Nocardia tenerifensis]PXX56346.1 MerR-like DNA binding protein [Nocardia tenerifensis]
MNGRDDSGAAEAEYSVGAVARELGIPLATLRSWNRRYGLGPSGHQRGRHRHYAQADLAVIGRMVELVRAGASPASAARAALGAAPALGDVAPVLHAALRLDAPGLLAAVSGHLVGHGVVMTWNRLCRPVFAEIVGRQARAGGLVDVEHLLSWAVATSLHRTVAVPARGAGRRPIVLACTAGEDHALPLEVLRAALAERGVLALFLGASVPDDALADAVSRQDRRPVVMLWAQSATTARTRALDAVRAGSREVVAAGPGWYGADLPVGIRQVNSLEDAVEHLVRVAAADP